MHPLKLFGYWPQSSHVSETQNLQKSFEFSFYVLHAFLIVGNGRSPDRHQLLQCEVGDACDRHVHGNQDHGLTVDCGCWRLAHVQRQHGIFRRAIQRIECVTGLHCTRILQRSILLFGMELFEFCHRRAQRAIQVSRYNATLPDCIELIPF